MKRFEWLIPISISLFAIHVLRLKKRMLPTLLLRSKLLFFAVIALCLGASLAPGAVSPCSSQRWVVTWQPTLLINGSPVLFSVSSPVALKAVSAEWLQHSVLFSSEKERVWTGLAGIPLSTPPGNYTIELNAETEEGKTSVVRCTVRVQRGKYRNVTIKVPRQFTEPTPEQLKQINRDKELKEARLGEVTAEAEWAGNFRAPVKAEVSDVFGTTRTINGKVQSVHQGLDYAVPTGTPVRALNGGTVLLARSLFFEGNCVVINHGQGLLTLYMHLSKIEVNEGERVQTGQVLGLSGGTGRATGPHLHIAVRWQGTYLDPSKILGMHISDPSSHIVSSTPAKSAAQ
jgi:murein DD-endopeptidase MepM/ murein hydrolase activator NlpD